MDWKEQIELFVEDAMDLALMYCREAARIAAQGMRHTVGKDKPELVRNFQVSYERAMMDAYTTGAIEALKLARGEKASLPWMGEQDTLTVARTLLREVRFKMMCIPNQEIALDPMCSFEACPSYDTRSCKLSGLPCDNDSQCAPWIEWFGPEPPVELEPRDTPVN